MGSTSQAPVLLTHLREHAEITHRLKHELQIGKHRFDLYFDKNTVGILEGAPPYGRSRSSSAWLFWAAAVFVVALLIVAS